jgi:hypothetical protein
VIEPAVEQAQPGAGERFVDSVGVSVWDPGHSLFGHFRLSRHPAEGRTAALGLVFADGEVAALERVSADGDVGWERASVGGVGMETRGPLERWSVSFSSDGVAIDLEAQATSAPLDVTRLGEQVARLTSASRYEQTLRLAGTARIGGLHRAIECRGVRVHCWGTPERRAIALWRSVHVAAEGRALGIVSARPAGSDGHGDELRVACRFPGGEAEGEEAFEEARLSTVYGRDGLPLKAGLELYPEGDEIPRRVAGQALCGSWVDAGDERLALCFFGWSWDGEPAYGSYEIVTSV